MEIANFELEKNLQDNGYDFVIGVDEAGRGPLCGPVVAAAVMLRNLEIRNHKFEAKTDLQNSKDKNRIQNTIYEIQDTKTWDLVRDSKKLSEKQRESVFDFIHENFHVGIGFCDHHTVDRINILEASFLAMKKAVQELMREIGNKEIRTIILVDGNKVIPNFSHEQKAIVGGDKLVKSIAAASIVAKVTRDRMMMDAHEKYPEYGFDKHKGYGTKAHMEALEKYGPCEIHRKSFGPVKDCLKYR